MFEEIAVVYRASPSAGEPSHAEASRYLARRCVRLCTRGIRWCAQTDKCGAIRQVPCPTLHTRGRPVCANGQVRRDTAGFVSDFAHAIRQRVHKRTSAARYGRSRVRKSTRMAGACAKSDTTRLHRSPTRRLPHAGAAQRGLSKMGARHAHLVACSTNDQALRTPSRMPSSRDACACRQVMCGTIHWACISIARLQVSGFAAYAINTHVVGIVEGLRGRLLFKTCLYF